MKIYANTANSIPTPYDGFVGKPLWVKCVYKQHPDDPNYTLYVRFIRKSIQSINDNSYVVFSANYFREVRLLQGYVKYLSEDTTEVRDIDFEYLSQYTPIQTYTSVELFDDYPTNINDNYLCKLAGKNLWVKVQCRSRRSLFELGWESNTAYIKVTNCQDGMISYDLIPGDLVDDYEYSEDWDDYGYTPVDPVIYDRYSPADTFDICKPTSVYSESDMRDILAQNEAVYWEGHNEVYGEDDEVE